MKIFSLADFNDLRFANSQIRKTPIRRRILTKWTNFLRELTIICVLFKNARWTLKRHLTPHSSLSKSKTNIDYHITFHLSGGSRRFKAERRRRFVFWLDPILLPFFRPSFFHFLWREGNIHLEPPEPPLLLFLLIKLL